MKITFHTPTTLAPKPQPNVRPDAKRRLVYGQPFLLPRPLESYMDEEKKILF